MRKHDWIISKRCDQGTIPWTFLVFTCQHCGTVEVASATNEEEKRLLMEATNCDAIKRRKFAQQLAQRMLR